MKVLFAASEAYPLVKTGGLGDVIYSLPHALQRQGADVGLVLPAYRTVLEKLKNTRIVGWLDIPGEGRRFSARIVEGDHDELGIPLLLVDIADLFDRPGNPYQHPDGYDWPDNAERYTVFARAVTQLAMDRLKLGWKPDVVHCHDWQTGLIPAMLHMESNAPKSVFTIHNLAYGGLFPHAEYIKLGLPASWWSSDGIEFFGNMSMLKAGIVFASQVTTVSPTYAREILTPEYGYGYEGVLKSIQYKFRGILNGVDPEVWNPRTDEFIPFHYSVQHGYLRGKRQNKKALLGNMGVRAGEKTLQRPLMGFVGRLVEQKGIDLLLDILPKLIKSSNALFVFLGTGQSWYEARLQTLAKKYPSRVLVHLGYSEPLAHLVEAGADLFLMPSRFEPCGLNQLYSLAYGTLPVVHETGGLADTVVDATPENVKNKTATGYVFPDQTPQSLMGAIDRALADFGHTARWRQLVRTAMRQDFSWDKSAQEYLGLYNGES